MDRQCWRRSCRVCHSRRLHWTCCGRQAQHRTARPAPHCTTVHPPQTIFVGTRLPNLNMTTTDSATTTTTTTITLGFCLLGRTIFSASTPLVGRQEEHPACKNWVMRCWRWLWLTDYGFTSHSTQNRSFRRRSRQANLLAWYRKTKPNTTKARTH